MESASDKLHKYIQSKPNKRLSFSDRKKLSAEAIKQYISKRIVLEMENPHQTNEPVANCPCCRQDVRIYKRRFAKRHYYMLYIMGLLGAHQKPVDLLVVDKIYTLVFRKGCTDYLELMRFEMIKSVPAPTQDNAHKVLHQLTLKGMKFLKGNPEHLELIVYNNKIIGIGKNKQTAMDLKLDKEKLQKIRDVIKQAVTQ